MYVNKIINTNLTNRSLKPCSKFRWSWLHLVFHWHSNRLKSKKIPYCFCKLNCHSFDGLFPQSRRCRSRTHLLWKVNSKNFLIGFSFAVYGSAGLFLSYTKVGSIKKHECLVWVFYCLLCCVSIYTKFFHWPLGLNNWCLCI